jgi:hypothetical protein
MAHQTCFHLQRLELVLQRSLRQRRIVRVGNVPVRTPRLSVNWS